MEDHPAGGCKRPIQQHRGGKAKDADRDIDAGTVTVQVAGVAETIPTPAPNATPSLRPTATKTINGTGSANTLPGTSANDLIDGKGGDAKIWAKNGRDVLIGGTGSTAAVKFAVIENLAKLTAAGVLVV